MNINLPCCKFCNKIVGFSGHNCKDKADAKEREVNRKHKQKEVYYDNDNA